MELLSSTGDVASLGASSIAPDRLYHFHALRHTAVMIV